MTTELYQDLQWRAFVNQCTDTEGMPKWLRRSRERSTAALIRRPTACTSGSLLPLMMLRRFQQAGHRPIALVGGATGMIGDPSGKSEERNLLVRRAQLQRKRRRASSDQMRQLSDFDAGERRPCWSTTSTGCRNSATSISSATSARTFPVNVMLAKDSVKSRLGATAGLSYTEFSYMLLQAYDFVHLNQKYGCELQIGGSDQWGNITAGIDLARRMHGVQLYGMTCPLLTKSDGSKMGKTESGAVWLSAGTDQSLRVLPVLDQRRRRRRSARACGCPDGIGPGRDRVAGPVAGRRAAQAGKSASIGSVVDFAGPWRRRTDHRPSGPPKCSSAPPLKT